MRAVLTYAGIRELSIRAGSASDRSIRVAGELQNWRRRMGIGVVVQPDVRCLKPYGNSRITSKRPISLTR